MGDSYSRGYMGDIWGDNGREHGNYYLGFRVQGLGLRDYGKKMETRGIIGALYGLYRDNGEENGNCYLGLRDWGLGFRAI